MNTEKTVEVSIIIPAYNAEKFLERAVASAVDQGPSVREVIIVDNNSTDRTAVVAQRLIRRYGERIIATNCVKQGAASARNYGISIASSEWIQFLDADDYLYPGKIDRQLELVTLTTDWVIGLSDVLKNGKVTTTFQHESDPWKGLVMCRGLGDTNANLFRRTALLKVGGYDHLMVGEDYHLYFKLLKAGASFVRDAMVGSAYVQHQGYRGAGRGDAARFKFRLGFVLEIEAYLMEQHAAYYEAEVPFFNAAKVAALRMYMTEDFDEGAKKGQEIFPESLNWNELPSSVLPVYWRAYSVVGFKNMERLRVTLREFKRKMVTGVSRQ